MMLLIDAGNTRIKWAFVKESDWLHSGNLPISQAGDLPQLLVGQVDAHGMDLHDIEQVWVCNVAGEEVARHIHKIGKGQAAKINFVTAQGLQCGVRNGYSRAGELGGDRWAALIGARHLVLDECLVVNCGTATTIDALSRQGDFMGGLILPGIEMMQNSLCSTTAGLIPGRGEYMQFPKNTADAMLSGAIQASCGAIQRQHALFAHASAPVVLSGGAAAKLREHLHMPLRLVDNLVLQGLLIIAQEMSKT